MPRGKPIKLENGTEFPNQKETTEFFKNILNSGVTKIIENDPDYLNVMGLYKRHPEFIPKSQNEKNISYFIIKDSGEYNTKCFHAVHRDGSQTDWSYRTAIKGKVDTKLQTFVDAARHCLELEIPYFRDSHFSSKCKEFIMANGFSENTIPEEWFSTPQNAQYRSMLLEPIKDTFVSWYKTQN